MLINWIFFWKENHVIIILSRDQCGDGVVQLDLYTYTVVPTLVDAR